MGSPVFIFTSGRGSSPHCVPAADMSNPAPIQVIWVSRASA